jgi:hypothetical protein
MTDEKPSEILTHREVLALLSEQARNGSVTAAVALERATSSTPSPASSTTSSSESSTARSSFTSRRRAPTPTARRLRGRRGARETIGSG